MREDGSDLPCHAIKQKPNIAAVRQRKGYDEKGNSCSFFLCHDRCHKKLIELSARGVRGQTHPVRSRLVLSHREG